MMALTMVVAVGGEKWSNSRYIFKVNLICFTDRLGMGLREREKSRMTVKFSA